MTYTMLPFLSDPPLPTTSHPTQQIVNVYVNVLMLFELPVNRDNKLSGTQTQDPLFARQCSPNCTNDLMSLTWHMWITYESMAKWLRR